MSHFSRILIADDNHDVADSLALLLQFLGHETCVAYDGQQAVELCATFEPDLVILDINMPVMDGYQAARMIRDANGSRLLMVACTGAAGWETEAKALEHGFDMHFSKPLDAEDLQDLLQRPPAQPT